MAEIRSWPECGPPT
uniref:Uncharacterized protein n=1 Tax=Plectus sambesii TaxID=2011161 RepID=A0A914VRP9_9BILA